jgi:two-component system sensor histidine kinase BaeS
MKIGITHRLFFSILAATCLAILCMFVIMQWSINRGFLDYLKDLDQVRLAEMAERLEQVYAAEGSWDFLQARPRGWIRHQLLIPPDETEGPERPDRPGADFHPMGRRQLRGGRGPGARIVILDADRRPLLGGMGRTDEATTTPVIYKGRTVGYVGLLPPRNFLSPQQLYFLRRQRWALVLAAAGIVAVVMMVSLPLARRLVRPIRTMAAAMHDIASGDYAVRVPVESSDELGALAADFNAMALMLARHEKERRQWIADISHELRTPLAVLRGEIEALLDGVRSVGPGTVKSLHAEVLRLHRLVDDLYQLSLSDIGALTYRKHDIDLREVLEDGIRSYQPQFAGKEISLSAETGDSGRVPVFADGERLDQLFSNLLDNSLKYTDSGGRLIVRLTCDGAYATVDFEDTAPGVPSSDTERLFDRLYRVERSRSRASGGAGLGLAICRNIVEAHGGTIAAHPSSLGGLLVRVSLPVSGKCL